ncbi:MAG: DUF1624 domain-containing protein [Nitriliruptorales bacterium]|nr:DUF1624 domain-containing protein [Nitriliruptorales bacterium]
MHNASLRPALPGKLARIGGRAASRLLGIDAARALAIIGMVMVHAGPVEVPGIAGTAYTLPYGRASILFATLAGIGVSLLTGDRSPQRLRDARLRLLVRAALLFPLGLVLQAMSSESGIAVILQYYAIYFLVAAAAAGLTDRRLLGVAAALLLTGPLTLFFAVRAFPAWFEVGGSATIAHPLALARDLMLTGYYPVLTWTPPLLVGMWLGRRDLRPPSMRWRLLVVGAVVAVITYSGAWVLGEVFGAPADPHEPAALVMAEPHTEMPLSLVGGASVAVAVLGGSLLVTAWLPRTTWPLVAMGQLALTIYVGQLVLFAVAPDALLRDTVPGAAFTVVRFTLVTLAAATLWRALLPRGPLEAAFSAPWALSQRLRRRRDERNEQGEPRPPPGEDARRPPAPRRVIAPI